MQHGRDRVLFRIHISFPPARDIFTIAENLLIGGSLLLFGMELFNAGPGVPVTGA